MQEYPKRAKLLLLLKYLKSETDEQHPATMADIIEHMDRQGISIERKSVYADISLLRDLGYDIVKTNANGNAYFWGSRDLEPAEAEIFASAVSAAKFITKKKSSELIGKLGAAFSCHQAAMLRQRLALARTQKTLNEEIYYNIDKIVTAQNSGCKISFLYFEYLPDKTQHLRRDGRRYLASPYTLMWFEDGLYVICNIDKYDNLSHFRVDRMTKIDVEESPVRNIGEFSEYRNYIDFDEYHRSVFSMFGGRPSNVRIRFHNSLATTVFDRFGLNTDVTDIEEETFIISVNVRVSPGFLSWLAIFGDKAELLAPESLRAEMLDMIHALQRVYND